MKKIILILVFILSLAGTSSAGFMPYGIGDVTNFLNDGNYFNGYTELESYDFNGEWQYTAIAFESGNINFISESPDGTITFTTEGISNSTPGNFGTFDTVNFDTSNLYFSDGNPDNVNLDSFSKTDRYFRVFMLTADSEPFLYLDTDSIFGAGTLIVGFNDNGFPASGDSDFDDIIVAMSAVPVPEPATMLLLGTGLIGLAGAGRKKLFKK